MCFLLNEVSCKVSVFGLSFKISCGCVCMFYLKYLVESVCVVSFELK